MNSFAKLFLLYNKNKADQVNVNNFKRGDIQHWFAVFSKQFVYLFPEGNQKAKFVVRIPIIIKIIRHEQL